MQGEERCKSPPNAGARSWGPRVMSQTATQGTASAQSIPYCLRMSAEFHINPQDELITFTATGAVTSSEACVCLDEMLAHPQFSSELPQLIDLRTAQIAGTADELKRFETFLLGDYGTRLNASVAVVVNPEWDEATCSHAFWLSCALQHAELFDDWNQACRWLIRKEFTAEMADLDAIASDPEGTPAEADPSQTDRYSDDEAEATARNQNPWQCTDWPFDSTLRELFAMPLVAGNQIARTH